MSLTKRAGSGSGSVSQRYGSVPNVTDPEHWPLDYAGYLSMRKPPMTGRMTLGQEYQE